MKTIAITLLTIFIANGSFASEVKVIKARTQLYAGTTADVITHLENNLRSEAIKACGSGLNISGLKDYKIKIGLLKSQDLLELDLESPDFSGAFVRSNNYPSGEATAKVVCKSNL